MNRLFQSRQIIFCKKQKVSVQGEFVNIFHTFGVIYTDVDLFLA